MELEHLDVQARLAPVVSPVKVVREDRLDQLAHPVDLDHQDGLGYQASLASRALQVYSVDHPVSLGLQVSRDSLVPLVALD